MTIKRSMVIEVEETVFSADNRYSDISKFELKWQSSTKEIDLVGSNNESKVKISAKFDEAELEGLYRAIDKMLVAIKEAEDAKSKGQFINT